MIGAVAASVARRRLTDQRQRQERRQRRINHERQRARNMERRRRFRAAEAMEQQADEEMLAFVRLRNAMVSLFKETDRPLLTTYAVTHSHFYCNVFPLLSQPIVYY